jgi:pimeloyl-ACP methyl ester carboxylesterase
VIHLLYGQGGRLTSWGFGMFGQELEREGHKVKYWNYSQWPRVLISYPAEPKTILLGYSIGANACAWIAKQYPTMPIDLIAALDPTMNGPGLAEYELGPQVKKAISFHQTGWWPTSLFFGGAFLTGPQVEVVEYSCDHFLSQFDRTVLERIKAEVNAVEKR